MYPKDNAYPLNLAGIVPPGLLTEKLPVFLRGSLCFALLQAANPTNNAQLALAD